MESVALYVAIAGLAANLVTTLLAGGRIAIRLEHRLTRIERGDEERDRRIGGLEETLAGARILMLGEQQKPPS